MNTNKSMEDLKKDTLIELMKKIKTKGKIKACKDCGELGHYNKKQLCCPLRIYNDELTMRKIKGLILEREYTIDDSIEDILVSISNVLDIGLNNCRTLYNKISPDELLYRKINIRDYIEGLPVIECNECKSPLYLTPRNNNYIWKREYVCDICWGNHEKERSYLWTKIREYKDNICYICNSKKENNYQRYNYDHINMFNKTKSIYTMVNEGYDLTEIYREIDKCQILCLECHNIVTDLENKLGFTRVKSSLSRSKNNGEISDDSYNEQREKYEKIYYDRMNKLYMDLREELTTNI